jgi:hypothetical protein
MIAETEQFLKIKDQQHVGIIDRATYRPNYRRYAESYHKRDEFMLRYRCGCCGAPPGWWCVTGTGLIAIELHRDRWRKATNDDLLPLVEVLRSVGIEPSPEQMAAQAKRECDMSANEIKIVTGDPLRKYFTHQHDCYTCGVTVQMRNRETHINFHIENGHKLKVQDA